MPTTEVCSYGFNTFVFESVFVFKHFACVAFNGSEHIRDVRVAFPLQEVSGWDVSARAIYPL